MLERLRENKKAILFFGGIFLFGVLMLVGTFGPLITGWPVELALSPVLAGVFAFCIVMMFKVNDVMAKIICGFIAILVVLGYALEAAGYFFDKLTRLFASIGDALGRLVPDIVLVQNTGQYDPQKYGISEYVSSLPWQFGIVVLLTALSYLNIRIASKKISPPFHGMMLIVSAYITWVYVSSINQVDVQASHAVMIIFSIGTIFAGYWATILDLVIFPLLGWEYTSDNKVGQFFIKAAQSCIKFAQVLTPVFILAAMAWFVSMTSLTMATGLQVLTQGMITGAVLSGAMREIRAIYRLYYPPRRREYHELEPVLQSLE